MAKPTSQIPQAKLDLYDKLLGAQSGVQRKGASMPYTSLSGNMFSFLTATGSLALRLPEDARHEFLKKYKTKLVEQNGTVLKEYVAAPDSLLKNTAELKGYFAVSYSYAKTLKPKPIKRKINLEVEHF